MNRRLKPPGGVAKFARVLTIGRLLRDSLHSDDLPDGMMLGKKSHKLGGTR